MVDSRGRPYFARVERFTGASPPSPVHVRGFYELDEGGRLAPPPDDGYCPNLNGDAAGAGTAVDPPCPCGPHPDRARELAEGTPVERDEALHRPHPGRAGSGPSSAPRPPSPPWWLGGAGEGAAGQEGDAGELRQAATQRGGGHPGGAAGGGAGGRAAHGTLAQGGSLPVLRARPLENGQGGMVSGMSRDPLTFCVRISRPWLNDGAATPTGAWTIRPGDAVYRGSTGQPRTGLPQWLYAQRDHEGPSAHGEQPGLRPPASGVRSTLAPTTARPAADTRAGHHARSGELECAHGGLPTDAESGHEPSASSDPVQPDSWRPGTALHLLGVWVRGAVRGNRRRPSHLGGLTWPPRSRRRRLRFRVDLLYTRGRSNLTPIVAARSPYRPLRLSRLKWTS